MYVVNDLNKYLLLAFTLVKDRSEYLCYVFERILDLGFLVNPPLPALLQRWRNL